MMEKLKYYFQKLMDEYIFPNNYKLSLWVSLIIGLAVLGMTNYVTKELM